MTQNETISPLELYNLPIEIMEIIALKVDVFDVFNLFATNSYLYTFSCDSNFYIYHATTDHKILTALGNLEALNKKNCQLNFSENEMLDIMHIAIKYHHINIIFCIKAILIKCVNDYYNYYYANYANKYTDYINMFEYGYLHYIKNHTISIHDHPY